ncbi:MAG: FAD-dependent oxidoreductase, partial [Actinomycetota bacterium]|nr:FAD-dependent oxidoreductase [Actinomycetota bacterium]
MPTYDPEELLHQHEHELLARGEAQPLMDEPVEADVLAVPGSGLGRRAGEARRVLVLGAGMAGLVAAYELKRQGHQPVVLEAQNRVGGRIYTMRSFAPGLYAEAGAMRIPGVHRLTLAYCEHFGLEMRPFITGNPNGLVYIGGNRFTMGEVEAEPRLLPFELSETEIGRTVSSLWDEATSDIRELLANHGPGAWAEITKQYDQYSLREFLELRGFSEGAIEMYGFLNFVETELNNAVVEELRENLGRHYEDMREIVGGMDQLPNAFYRSLADDIRFGTNVTAVEQDAHSVTVHYKTESGRFSETADFAICTIPFSVLPTIDFVTPLTREKQRAIRQLNYSASTKILFQVRDRIWETDDGIEGGATVCDLAVRRLNYPTPDPITRRGILLASYT